MSKIRVFFGGQTSNIFDPVTLQLWDPSRNFVLRSLLSFTCSPTCCQESSAFANVPIDWKETSETHILKADLPGLKKEEVKVEVGDRKVLQISGERNVKKDKFDAWHRIKRSNGKFLRRLKLPENANMNDIHAVMENGVLTITILKEEVKKPNVRAVEISG